MMLGIAGCDAFGVRKEMGNADGVIKVDGSKASVDVTYNIVDWKPLYKETHDTADDLVKAIRGSKNVINVDGSLDFEKDGGLSEGA